MINAQEGWYENEIYPGTHWLFYNERMDYIARIDLGAWTNGKFMWRVMDWSRIGNDRVGFCESLEEAKAAAEKAMHENKFVATKAGGFRVYKSSRYVQEALF